MPNSGLAFGIDISRYNSTDKHLMNFDEVASHVPRVMFIGIRASISWGYQDPWYAFHYQEALRIKRLILPYHVIFPMQPANRQMDNFFRVMGDINFDQVRPVLDLELDHSQTVTTITKCTFQALNIIKNRTGQKPIIYSRTSWVNRFLKVQDLPPCHWWLAQYRWPVPFPLYTPEFPSPPRPLPTGVSTWLIHQTTDRGYAIGQKSMHFQDHNRWNGSEKDVLKFANQPQQVLITCPVDDKLCTGGKYTDA